MSETSSYMNPTVDAGAHGSHSQQAINELTQQQDQDHAVLASSSGKHHRQTAGGRTLNVPKTLPENTVPDASYNSAVTTGSPCQGLHCAIPVTPTDSNIIHTNLSSANPPPGANTSYPGTQHLGNNYNEMPGISPYQGTALNHGPFTLQTGAGMGDNRSNIGLHSYEYIADPSTNKRVRLMSNRGLTILRKYLHRCS
jgi:hypothetical protein